MTVKYSKQLIAGIAATLLVGLGVAATLWTLTKIVDAAALRAVNVAALTTGADLLSSFQGADADQRGMDSVRAELASFIQIVAGALALQDTALQSSLRLILTLVAATTLLALLFAIALTRSIRRPAPERLGTLIDPETARVLNMQEVLNRQLQQTNTTLSESEQRLAVTLNSIGDAVIATDAQARVTRLNPGASEEPLLKAGSLQRAILNSTNFSSIATDARGVIQIFNVGAQRMLGYTAADVIDRVTPADISDPQEAINRATALTTELGTPITPGLQALVCKASRDIEDIYEQTYIRKDGSRFPAVVSVTALRDAQETIIGYLLIGTDNTARMRVEAERARLDQALKNKNVELQSAKIAAEGANLAKSDFLSSMSHELRTPLGAILGFAQLMESGSPPPTGSQRRSIDQILKAGWYLLELINEILDLALIESGKLSMSLEPISLPEVMRECEAMIEPEASASGIHVAFTPLSSPLATSCYVQADRTRMKQILINLLSNAIKYNKPGGTVAVETVLTNARSVRISVRDTGGGLAPAQLAQLFQPFNRLGQEGTDKQGTGIGLVVCKRLVEWMGGLIGVESTVGEGSVFWVELDLTTEPHAEARTNERLAIPSAELRGSVPLHTLLYVEDNPANLMLVEDIIQRRPDIRLLSASDGMSGIAMARTALPDVILMDINLPGVSGIDALRILSADHATKHIPVIAISANAVPRDIEKGLQAGFFRYLTKPIKVTEFMDTLDVALTFPTATRARDARQEPA